MHRSSSRLVVFACALVASLLAATAASAANGPVPWEGGAEVQSEFELRASAASSELARRQVWEICASPDEWNQIGSVQGFSPERVWGITPFDAEGPLDFAVLSPQACFYASEWLYATDRRAQKWCVTGTRTEYRTEQVTKYRTEYRKRYRTVVRRKTVNGKVTKVRVRVPVRVAVRVPYQASRQVPYEVPVEEVCEDYVVPKLFAWDTLVHEATHLAGLADEAVTECFALQNLTWFAWKMGIDEPQAREVGADYWSLFYVPFGPEDPEYYSTECRDGGALDLRPDSSDWPLVRRGSATVPLAGYSALLSRPVTLHATVR